MRRWWVGLSAAFIVGQAWAQPYLGLVDSAQRALKKAPALAAAAAQKEVAIEDIALARASLLPFLHGTGEFTHIEQKYKYTKPLPFLAPNVNFNRLSLDVELVQPLFHLDRWAALAQGKQAAEIAALSYRLARQALLLEVSDAYLSVLSAQSALDAVKAQEKAVAELYAKAKASLEAGAGTLTDKLDAESRLDMVRSNRIQAENGLAQAKARLVSLIGPIDKPLLGFSPRFPVRIPDLGETARWEDKAGEEALDVRIKEAQLAIAREEVRRSYGQALPSLDAFAGLEREKQTSNIFGTGSTVRTESIGIKLEVPLYAGGATLAQIRKARKLQVQAEEELAEARRKARLAARKAFLNQRAAAAQVVALKQALVSAEQAVQAAQIGYEVGLRNIVERLDAEERLAEARSHLAQAKASYLLATLQLVAVVGGLGENEVEKVQAFLSLPNAL